MKTAISIPDALYREAEKLGRKLKKPRSRLYCEALQAYLASHDFDAVTEAANAVVSKLELEPDLFLSAAARRVLKRTEW